MTNPKASFCLLPFLFLFLSLTISLTLTTTDYPLFTKSRWIVNEKGHRVKLACANWPSHLEPVVAEGLSKQPMDSISKRIKQMGFNCVRLTWPLELMTNDTLGYSVTLRQSFERYGLKKDLDGIRKHNPAIVDFPLVNVFQAVVFSLGKHDVMVILDNHKTVPGWCCSNDDPDAFFGDPIFKPDRWILGLKKMASIFEDVKNVVGMSLRNELRSKRENPKDWFKYMQKGAEAVHTSNPNVLVILSGLDFDADLSFLKGQQVNLSFKNKLVFELHWYAFTNNARWETTNPNDFCARMFAKERRNGGFLLEKGFPLFLSEFGTDTRGGDNQGNRYMNCMLAWAVEKDIDWAVWALTGDYYLRQGQQDVAEYYGVLDSNWHTVRNSSYLRRLKVIQPPHKGPGIRHNHHKKLFHPLTGLCIVRKRETPDSKLILGPCTKDEPWSYNHHGTLMIKTHNSSCVVVRKTGEKYVKLGKDDCAKIERISASKMHLSFHGKDRLLHCLDVDSKNNVVWGPCKCLTDYAFCEPGSQWFKVF